MGPSTLASSLVETTIAELTDREYVCPNCTLIHLKTAGPQACDLPEGLLA